MLHTAGQVDRQAVDSTVGATPPPPGHADRRDLLHRISNFLLDHELEISANNLVLARALMTGDDPALGHRIAARRLAGEPIDQAWLDEMAGLDEAAGSDEAAGPDEVAARPAYPPPEQTFADALQREVGTAQATAAPLSVALCDVDGLRSLTETYGPDMGNRVTQAVGRALHRITARHCHAAGHGGRDFALLFRGLTPDEAGSELDLARETFTQRRLIDRRTDTAIGKVTFSGGVADIFAYATPADALDAADDALAQARAQGCNRVVVSPRRIGPPRSR